MLEKEKGRQIIHIALGLSLLLFLHLTSHIHLLAFLGFGFMFGLLLINILITWKGNFQWIRNIIILFSRKNEKILAEGSVWYVAGLLLATTIIMETPRLSATILALSLGDGLATLIGIKGKRKLPWNRKKTWEGTLAFFLSTLLSYAFIGWIAIPFAFFLALIESLPSPIDDNFSIPIASAVFFTILRA